MKLAHFVLRFTVVSFGVGGAALDECCENL